MPLILNQYILDGRGRLLLWHAKESTDELKAIFQGIDPNVAIANIKLEKRQREFIVGRLLLNVALPGVVMKNLSNGKPMVDGSKHISFSHSDDVVGLVVAEHPVGLDIQKPDEKLLRIAKKFCNSNELDWIESLPNPMDGALVIWSAKEAVFKVFGEKIEFAEEMTTTIRSPRQPMFHLRYRGSHGRFDFEIHQTSHDTARILYTMLDE